MERLSGMLFERSTSNASVDDSQRAWRKADCLSLRLAELMFDDQRQGNVTTLITEQEHKKMGSG